MIDRLEKWLAAEQARCTGSWPLVTLSYAQSLDGCLSPRRGQPLALSSPQALRVTHLVRAWHDAILVGVDTVLADNPRLTVRLVDGPSPQPVILDSHLRTPQEAWLVCEHPHPAWIATLAGSRGSAADRPCHRARLLELPAGPDGRISLPALLDRLGDLGMQRLMVEGGARVLGAFIRQELANLAVITISPQYTGGLQVIESDPRPTQSGAYPRLEDVETAQIGADLLVWGRLTYT